MKKVSVQPSGESTDLRDGSSPSLVAELRVLNPVVEVQNRSGSQDEIVGSVSDTSLVSPPRTITPPVESTTVAPLPSSTVPDQKTMSDNATSTATPLSRLGAWAKPIKFLSPTSHLNLTLQTDGGEAAQIPFKEHWPSLSEQDFRPTGKHVANTGSFKGVAPGIEKLSDRKENALRFPWAARMNPASRNLFRATEPEYLDDGTPKVTIPTHVLQQGLSNQREYILGQFYRCSPPPGGMIYAVFNKLWGRKCRITIQKLGESSYLFHIPDEASRNWVLSSGVWHIDDCLMFVAPRTPEATLAIPEIKTIPIWVTLKKIPHIVYSIPGISHIASGLGATMATHKPRLDPMHMEEAKILVEVELSKAFPQRIAASDETGFISMVDVEYAWLPTVCTRCGHLGHKVKRCLQSDKDEAKNTDSAAEEVQAPSKSAVEEVQAPSDSFNINKTSNTLEQPNELSYSKNSAAAMSHIPSGMEVSPPSTLFVMHNASTSVDPVTENEDELLSLATLSILENMCLLPSFVCINGTVESPSDPSSESSVDAIPNAQVNSPAVTQFQKEKDETVEVDLGSNKFVSLMSFEEEEDFIDSDKEVGPMDLMTPSGERILRERPVKPSTKAKEMHSQHTSRGRGNRGRGRRGGHG
ncbi:hypothetical protein Bca4012_038828 [Brassica carinata]